MKRQGENSNGTPKKSPRLECSLSDDSSTETNFSAPTDLQSSASNHIEVEPETVLVDENVIIHAILSYHCYQNRKLKEGNKISDNLKDDKNCEGFENHLENWTVKKNFSPTDEAKDFSATLFAQDNHSTKRLILAFEGTDPMNIHDIKADILEVLLNLDGPYVIEAKRVTMEGIKLWENEKYDEFSITGHSLGGFLASASLLQKNTLNKKNPPIKVYLYDSPGLDQDSLSKLEEEGNYITTSEHVMEFMIKPNAVNCRLSHFPNLYTFVCKFPRTKYSVLHLLWNVLSTHGMKKFLTILKQTPQMFRVNNWPHDSRPRGWKVFLKVTLSSIEGLRLGVEEEKERKDTLRGIGRQIKNKKSA